MGLRLVLCWSVAGAGFDPAWAQSQAQSQHPGPGAKSAASSTIAAGKKGPARSPAEVALLAKGATLHKEGKVEEAEVIFKQVLSNNPRSVDAFYDLGAIAEGRGDLVGALSFYRAALALRSGDKELLEAVTSTESALRKGAASIKNENRKEASKNSPMGLAPASVQDHFLPAQSLSHSADQPPTGGPTFNKAPGPEDMQALSDALSRAQAECRNAKTEDNPIFSVPAAEAEAAPQALAPNLFSLSSSKGAIVAPSVGVPLDQSDIPRLGITPDQFPDPGRLTGQTAVCPPPCPPNLTVGANQTNNRGAMVRSAAMVLSIGAGMVLGGALHCPICHMMRGHL